MQLGIVLTPYGQIPGAPPWEIGYSYGGDGTFLCPEDPYYNQRGESGFYHDTRLGSARQPLGFFGRMRAKRVAKALRGLGSIPTNFDLAPTYGWVPMIDSMVAAKEGYTVGTWIPPNGYQPGPYSPMSTPGYGAGMSGLGFLRDDAGSTVTPTTAPPVASTTGTTPDAVQAAANAAASAIDATLQDHQDRMFKLTIISTTVVALSAIVATLRTWKQLKRDERREMLLEEKLGI